MHKNMTLKLEFREFRSRISGLIKDHVTGLLEAENLWVCFEWTEWPISSYNKVEIHVYA